MKIQFKIAATEDELREVSVLATKIWNQHFVPIIGQAQVDYMLEKYNSVQGLRHHIEVMGYEVNRAYLDKKLCGYLSFALQKDELFLSKFYLDATFRGMGLGRACFNYLIQRARAKNKRKIRLTVNKNNSETIAVYKHMGFSAVEAVVVDIEKGFVMDDYVMEYLLKYSNQ